MLQEQKKDILDIIDDGIQEAYRRFRIEELERNKVVRNENEKIWTKIQSYGNKR